MDLDEAVREHEKLFNDAVRAGDFTAFLATFAEDAVMSFDGVPVGPYKGREAIAEAYATRPPTDTMTVWSIEEAGPDTADVRFDWDAGGGGSMRVKWREGLVAALTIAFRDQPAD
ncbi:MAG TPA: nuclear transport factor 2 family protein [Candidatus Limnocylindrales bacterium]